MFCSVEIALSRIVGRRDKKRRRRILVMMQQCHDIEFARCDQLCYCPASGRKVCMTPTVALADPGEMLCIISPEHLVMNVYPGRIALRQDDLGPPGLSDGKYHAVGVLSPVQLLQYELL